MSNTQFDYDLMDAFEKRIAELRRDPQLLLKFAARRHSPAVLQPHRAFCLVIRASDTRLSSWNCYIEADLETADRFGLPCDYAKDPHLHETTHSLRIDKQAIKTACAAVIIPWPGVPKHDAADMLGVAQVGLQHLIRSGALKVSRADRAQCHRSRGKDKQIVYTPSPVDPNSFGGRAPHWLWGTLWQYHYDTIPDSFCQRVSRIPTYRNQCGRRCFSGWNFVCPGRPDANGKLVPCNRLCRYLYSPVEIPVLAQITHMTEPLKIPRPDGTFEDWIPGVPHPFAGRRSFACKHCWGVRGFTMSKPSRGLNEVVTTLSGGVLYGKDVRMPANAVTPLRKRRYMPRTDDYELHRLRFEQRRQAINKRRQRDRDRVNFPTATDLPPWVDDLRQMYARFRAEGNPPPPNAETA